jgi:hypothetical protein
MKEMPNSKKMNTRRIPRWEVRAYCHDCHNRAALEVNFAHRQSIGLCERCARSLVAQVTEVLIPKEGSK